MPVQVIAYTIAGGLYGAGKLQEAGKLPNPFAGKDEKSSTDKPSAEAEAPAPAAAAA